METEKDLARVLGELTEIMSARGCALTLHPEGEQMEVVYADHRLGLERAVVERIFAEHIGSEMPDASSGHRWIDCQVQDVCRDILVLPVEKSFDHSQLLITLYFDDLTEERRANCEDIYRRRAPFAVGYFRLWQHSRTHAREVAAMRTALNLSEMGIFLINRASKIIFSNRAAKRMIEAGDGLLVARESIRAAQPADSPRLQVALDHVIAANTNWHETRAPNRPAPFHSLKRKNGPPLVLSVLPTEARAIEPSDAAAIIYVIDPARNIADLLAPVCKIYGLSPVETRLACLLASGETLTGATKKMRLMDHTARGYLKQIFLKTDTNRQSALIQLLLSSVIHTDVAVIPQPF